MRLPFNSVRYREATADWAVFLSFTWPLWLWTRLYYGYYIIEWAAWRTQIDPTLALKKFNIV